MEEVAVLKVRKLRFKQVTSEEKKTEERKALMTETEKPKLDGVKTYMRLRRVPGHLQGKVVKWFDYLWLTHKSSDEEKAVSCLPGEQL
ncbi:unnamed protein product, partial [Cyprideis torosa]